MSGTIDRRDSLLPLRILAHRALRYARWAWEAHGYATRRSPLDADHVLVAECRSRLVRDPRRALLEMAAGKATNLKLAAAALDGIVVEPGETLSFWFLVGEPSRARGFERGMELRSGCVVPTVGGGLCQLASAVFEVGLRTGLTVVERHAHSLEIAPEPDRIRPFGATASVLYPYRDVQLENELDRAVIVSARLERDELVVGAYGRGERAEVIDLEERGYRRWRQAGRLFRGGELWQIARDRRTRAVSWERRVLAAETPVLEQMPQSHCYTCDRACPNAIPRDDPEARAVRLEMGSGQ